MRLLVLLLSLSLFSCRSDDTISVSEMRNIKVGMSTEALKCMFGEPLDIELSSETEVWQYRYATNWENKILSVFVVADTVKSFSTNY